MKFMRIHGKLRKKRLDCVKNDILYSAFSYARWSKALQETTGFGTKDCLSLPGLWGKYTDGLRTEEDEPIFTYCDKDMSWFFEM